jgi:hypothetical protein
MIVTTFIAGLGYATGLVRSVGGMTGLWVHIAVALALVPLALWHILARRIRPRRSDLSRRTFLRAGLLGSGPQGSTALPTARSGSADCPVLPGGSPAPTRGAPSIRTPCPTRSGSKTRSRPSIRIAGS